MFLGSIYAMLFIMAIHILIYFGRSMITTLPPLFKGFLMMFSFLVKLKDFCWRGVRFLSLILECGRHLISWKTFWKNDQMCIFLYKGGKDWDVFVYSGMTSILGSGTVLGGMSRSEDSSELLSSQSCIRSFRARKSNDCKIFPELHISSFLNLWSDSSITNNMKQQFSGKEHNVLCPFKFIPFLGGAKA